MLAVSAWSCTLSVLLSYSFRACWYFNTRGHELVHGFDNQGRLYDGTGVLVNWWEPNTSKKFDGLASFSSTLPCFIPPFLHHHLIQYHLVKAQCVIDQYSQFQPIPNATVNGKLTQVLSFSSSPAPFHSSSPFSCKGENIADMGGIKYSYSAIRNRLGGIHLPPLLLLPTFP